jgi:hypothetical protein
MPRVSNQLLSPPFIQGPKCQALRYYKIARLSEPTDPQAKMAPQRTVRQIRLNNIISCLTFIADTLQILASSFKTPFLEAISNTTQSLLKNIQVILN